LIETVSWLTSVSPTGYKAPYYAHKTEKGWKCQYIEYSKD